MSPKTLLCQAAELLPELGEAVAAGKHCAGFVGASDRLIVLLPDCYGPERSEPSSLADAVLLWRVLARYRAEGDKAFVDNESLQASLIYSHARSEAGTLTPLEVRLLILQDFQENGLIQFRGPITCVQNKGRINWRATFQTELPVHCGSTSVYARTRHRVLSDDREHPLTRLHGATVNRVARLFGEPNLEASRNVQSEPHQSEAHSIISNNRNRVFADRHRLILRLLEAFWKDSAVGSERRAAYWDLSRSFEHVWQWMCNTVFGGRTGELRDRFPSASYELLSGASAPGLTLRPDILIPLPDKRLLILDPKFYTSGTLPASADILKQLAYAYFLSHKVNPEGFESSRIINAFLLPGMNTDGSWCRYLGSHRFNNALPHDHDPMCQPIHLLQLNYPAVAQAYCDGNRLPVNSLVRTILKYTP
jgi:hypothetical protein